MVKLDTRRLRDRGDDDACVERAVPKPDNLGSCRCLAQFQAHVRSCPSERSDRIGQSPIERASDIAEPDEACAPGCRFARRRDRMIGLAQRLARLMQEGQSGFGQAKNAIAAPLDQVDAKILFKPSDRHRQRRLRHSETLSRAVKMTLLGHRDELLHLAKVNHPARRQ